MKTIIRGSDGRYLEHSAYDAWGKRSNAPLPTLPATGESFRYHFSGKEDQSVDFSVPFTDFGARHYSPSLRRWLVPDPLSEKYYDVSPYAYCAGDPVNLVDEDGRDFRKRLRNNTYIISSTYYVKNIESYESAKIGISFWNKRTNDTYTDQSGKTFRIKYNLSVKILNFRSHPVPGDNYYEINDEKIKKYDVKKEHPTGTTPDGKHLYVKRDYSMNNPLTGETSSTPAHEIGHSLGMEHQEEGVMSLSQDSHRNANVTQENIEQMMNSNLDKSTVNNRTSIFYFIYEKIKELF